MSGTVFLLTGSVFTPLVAALLALLCVHALNRFLHLDGLCDLGDGLIAGGDKERKVAAMKDSRTGAGGVSFLFFFEALGVFALAMAVGQAAYMFFAPLAAEVLVKTAMVTCASRGEARPGLGGAFVSASTGRTTALTLLLSSAILIVAAIALGWYLGWGVLEVILVPLALVLVAALIGAAMAGLSMRSFGMVNGDVLGATNEVARPIVLLALPLVVICVESVRL